MSARPPKQAVVRGRSGDPRPVRVTLGRLRPRGPLRVRRFKEARCPPSRPGSWHVARAGWCEGLVCFRRDGPASGHPRWSLFDHLKVQCERAPRDTSNLFDCFNIIDFDSVPRFMAKRRGMVGEGSRPNGTTYPSPTTLRPIPPSHAPSPPTLHALARVGGSPHPLQSPHIPCEGMGGRELLRPAAAYETRLAHDCRVHSGPISDRFVRNTLR